jgi:histidine triad (HIT) family protein
MEKTEPDCIFCRIVRKEIPGDIVYEDDNVLVFKDIDPKAPVHILIIPKDHIPGVLDLEERHKELMGHILIVASNLAAKTGIDESGFRIVLNAGEDAGQAVSHIHFHLLGGRALTWPPG